MITEPDPMQRGKKKLVVQMVETFQAGGNQLVETLDAAEVGENLRHTAGAGDDLW